MEVKKYYEYIMFLADVFAYHSVCRIRVPTKTKYLKHYFYEVTQSRIAILKSADLKREVKRGSNFTLTSDLSCIASILFANVNFTHVRTEKLRYTGNQP